MAKIKMGLRLLETLTSALYDDPIILFREYVQNSVDAYNHEVGNDSTKAIKDFHVNIVIGNNSIEIIDNGYGIPENEFFETMTDIGISKKSEYLDQIGFRGIGRLSAMPFCEELTFINKPQGSNECFKYTWEGEKFHELLNKNTDVELSRAIDKITKSSQEPYDGNIADHFFKVLINHFNVEISDLVKQNEFKIRLEMMLPLNYNPKFTYQKELKKKYLEYMGEKIDKFSFCVKLNGDTLFKPHANSDISESGIHYLEIQYPSKKKDNPGDHIGLLWYTFDKKIEARKQNQLSGILVRSKNMLMGDNNALATAIFRNKDDNYITNYRELTQTLQGVCGEMLLNSPQLKDNARRDWFRIDENSIILRDIIFDFLKRLYNYRKIASQTFNQKKDDKDSREKFKTALLELTSNPDPKTFFKSFYDAKEKSDKEKERKKAEKLEQKTFEFADEDCPNSSITFKRDYEQIISALRDYYNIKGELQEFLKIRSYIKKMVCLK
jgi:molecular chaperone HtpG